MYCGQTVRRDCVLEQKLLLVAYGKSYLRNRLIPAFICNFWHPGTLTLRAERQSARMSKITNDGLTRTGIGCFIAVPSGRVQYMAYSFFSHGWWKSTSSHCEAKVFSPVLRILSLETGVYSKWTVMNDIRSQSYLSLYICTWVVAAFASIMLHSLHWDVQLWKAIPDIDTTALALLEVRRLVWETRLARDSMLIARCMLSPGRPSVCHTGGSVKNNSLPAHAGRAGQSRVQYLAGSHLRRQLTLQPWLTTPQGD